jgi:hypothetical protein
MLSNKMDNDMNVIGHDHKDKQFHLPGNSQVLKTVNDNPLDHIAVKKMDVLHGGRCHKIEVIGVES